MFCTDSKSTLLTSRINGGQYDGHRDYMVYLRKSTELIGTGISIGYKVVLTAAHCVYDLKEPIYDGVRVINASVMTQMETPNIPNSKGQPKVDYTYCNYPAIESLVSMRTYRIIKTPFFIGERSCTLKFSIRVYVMKIVILTIVKAMVRLKLVK